MNTQISFPNADLKEIDGGITTAQGFRAGGFHCGMKRKRKDLGWLFSEVPATAAAVYTTNSFQAAPLQVTKESIATEQKIQGLIVNSAVANACTGEEGLHNAYQMRHWFATKMGIDDHLVAVNSTGVIGKQLDMEKLRKGIAQINVDHSIGENFGQAILTTDTFSKKTCIQCEINNQWVTIGGAAKGSGMINPNMATMLSFITTDAEIEADALDSALRIAVNETFNCITVDGDTSTNDTVMVMANGLAENNVITLADQDGMQSFIKALTYVCRILAKQIASDGEGATKLVEVHVKGAKIQKEAQAIAKAIVGSSLVKTAIFGADANWGRIVCAIGYSGVQLDANSISVSIGGIQVVKQGMPADFDEEAVQHYLQHEKEILIAADLNAGNQEAHAWGCDLSYDYVKINASYRT